MKILVVGAGYVGLSTGVVLAESHEVRLLEINEERVQAINRGESPIYERGIDELLMRRFEEGTLKAILPSEEIGRVDVVFICVGTPSSSDGSVDLSQVQSAVDSVMERLEELLGDYLVIIMKSTVPPGTTRSYVRNRVEEKHLLDRVGVVFNPEFLREGTALEDARCPDRTVIGCTTSREFETAKRLYSEILDDDSSIYVRTNIESAELCKYVSNSFLATKISFANEMANIAEKISGADIDEVMRCVGLDSRISPRFFGAGAGYGGSCFPKDTLGLMHLAARMSTDTPILRAADRINRERPKKLVEMLESLIGNTANRKVSVLGLAFKPRTDDTRYSPALKVIDMLLAREAEIIVHDPLAERIGCKIRLSDRVKLTSDIEECMMQSEGAILVTDWPLYKELGLEKITDLMKNPAFVDGRRVFSDQKHPSSVKYVTVGTGADFINSESTD